MEKAGYSSRASVSRLAHAAREREHEPYLDELLARQKAVLFREFEHEGDRYEAVGPRQLALAPAVLLHILEELAALRQLAQIRGGARCFRRRARRAPLRQRREISAVIFDISRLLYADCSMYCRCGKRDFRVNLCASDAARPAIGAAGALRRRAEARFDSPPPPYFHRCSNRSRRAIRRRRGRGAVSPRAWPSGRDVSCGTRPRPISAERNCGQLRPA